MARGFRFGLVIASVVALTFVAVAAQALYGPGRALACSCVQPMPTLAEVALDPSTVVVAGTIGPQTPERTPVQVDTWFAGPNPQPVVWLAFGSQMMTSCDPFVTPGERRLLVLSRHDQDLFGVNPCVAETGVIGEPQGDAALAAAHELFGGQPIATPEPTPPPEIGETPGMDVARLYIAGAVGVALLLLAGVVLFAMLRRRRTPS